jgi:hypothetical protein
VKKSQVRLDIDLLIKRFSHNAPTADKIADNVCRWQNWGLCTMGPLSRSVLITDTIRLRIANARRLRIAGVGTN